MALNPQGMSVQHLYRLYQDQKLSVNRIYQRKLVWAVDEKQKLVDSMIAGFPVPLILFAEKPKGSGSYEIIDGLQRLNAIFSFIDGQFTYNGVYFDYREFTRVRQLVEEGTLTYPSTGPFLSREDCAKVLEYTLAVTIFPSDSDNAIKDVFGRINSNGKQLSNQEKRQAGATTELSNLIRVIACEIRGDVSRDILLINEMPQISIDSALERIGYGIRAEDTFWVKQGILTVKQLRESEDEQMLLDIILSVVGENPVPASQEYFDEIYDIESERYKEAEKCLLAYGVQKVEKDVKYTLSILKEIVESQSGEQNFLRNTVRVGNNRSPIKTPFYTIFLAFFELIVNRRKTPIEYGKILNSLRGMAAKVESSSHYANTEDRIKNRDLTIGLLQNYFVDREPSAYGHGESLAIDFSNSLRRSKVETSRYELKQGILTLDDRRREDTNVYSKIVNTICGIANLGKDSEGNIFIGVADKKSDFERIAKLDGTKLESIGDRYIVGIERECKILGIDLSDYAKKLIASVKNSQLSEPLRSQVCTQVDNISYKGFDIIRLHIPPQKQISFVGEQCFIREADNTIEIKGQKVVAISKLFE